MKRLEQFLGRSLSLDENPTMAKKPRRKSSPAASTPTTAFAKSKRQTLEQAVPGGYPIRVAERGSAFKIITSVTKWPEMELFSAAFHSPESPIRQRILHSCRSNATLEELLFVDLETTGLAHAPLFLIGVMTWEQDGLLIRQFFARNAREEAAVIQSFLELAASKSLLITFNGKSFDLPTLYQRAEANEVPCVLHAYHFDLLHECRRVWRDQLPNCQLQTLEERICGHPPRTEEDIPGEQIPIAYQTYLNNGNAWPIAHIIRHNAQDLLTMAELLIHLPALPDC